MTEHTAFVLAGLPGSGKSTVADIIAGESTEGHGLDAVHTEVSDYCRTAYEAAHDGDTTGDNDLGRWTKEVKAERGQDYFVREMAETHVESDNDVTIISGARSPEEAEAVRDVFGTTNTVVIAVWTLPDLRFERKYGDAPSEDHPKWDEFCERNERETHDWGCLDYFADMTVSDYIVPNNGDIEQVESIVASIVREQVGDGSITAALYEETPFPDGLPSEAVAQYL